MKQNTSRNLQWLTALAPVLLIMYFAFYLYEPMPDSPPAPEVTLTEEVLAPKNPTEPTVATAAVNEELPDVEPKPQDVPANEQVIRDREFISKAFPVLSSWDVTAVKPLLADATVEASTDAQLNEVMAVLSERLGELESFETPIPMDPAAAGVADASNPDAALAHYRFMAHYETGEAAVNLVLHRDDPQEDSSLYSFNIQVPN